jgi:hypothetical protein
VKEIDISEELLPEIPDRTAEWTFETDRVTDDSGNGHTWNYFLTHGLRLRIEANGFSSSKHRFFSHFHVSISLSCVITSINSLFVPKINQYWTLFTMLPLCMLED